MRSTRPRAHPPAAAPVSAPVDRSDDAEGKFYALFSLLFGLGIILLMERIEARSRKFVPLAEQGHPRGKVMVSVV